MFDIIINFFATLQWDAVLKIVAIDVLLGGDNAVLIALACKDLPKEQRRKGILWGTAGAIILRILLVFFAMSLLKLPFLKLVSGVLLLWIGIKLLTQNNEDHGNVKSSDRLLQAIKTIIIADLLMSVENVIGIAGAVQSFPEAQQLPLIIFGILISIPIIVSGSQLVLKALDKYPVIISLGGSLLGWIGGGLILSDIIIEKYFLFNPRTPLINFDFIQVTPMLIAEILGAVFVFFVGKYISNKR